MIEVPKEFQPTINTVYPPNNHIEYERWFFENFTMDVTDREYLPIFFCAYQVNNNYGQDVSAMQRLQDYVDTLPIDKKYFTISQYDDGVGVDWEGKDVLEFNMSKVGENKYPLPLIGQPYPYEFPNESKKYLANFVGSITYPIREHAKKLQGKDGYYISFDRHEPEEYCRIIAQSYFTLCYRGYGINSFRLSESLQYQSIPIYISDDFILPHGINFLCYGVLLTEERLAMGEMDYWMNRIMTEETLHKEYIERGKEIYQDYFTYEGTKDKIIKHLLTIK